MLPPPRQYQDERDLARMLSLLQAGRAAGIPACYVHPGDLKWWLYYPPLGSTWWDHIFLWEDPADSSSLLGWALLDPHGETFDVYYRPDLHGSTLAEGMFAWSEEAVAPLARDAGEKQTGMFWVSPEDLFRKGWLESRGYQVRYQSAALIRCLSEPIPDSPVPAGFTVRSCRGLAEVEARALAQYGAFDSEAAFDQYVQRFTRFMQSPAYDPDNDLVVAAPDGRIASFCITWRDEFNKVGLFEPVGTHPDFQRQGLGRAVMLEGLRRLRALGMQEAIVSTGESNHPALQLYSAVGFQPYNRFCFYSRPLE